MWGELTSLVCWVFHSWNTVYFFVYNFGLMNFFYQSFVAFSIHILLMFSSVQSLSRVQPFVTPWYCSMPCFPVHHQLPELTQTHVQQVTDAVQPSLPLLFPFPPAFNLSQHQGLFHWVSSLHQVAKVWSFNFSISLSNEYSKLISFRIDWFDLISLLQGITKGLSRVFSSTTIQKYQFFGTLPSLWSNSHIHTWPLR